MIDPPISRPNLNVDAVKEMMIPELLDVVAHLICTRYFVAHDSVILGCMKNHLTQENIGMIDIPISKPKLNSEAGKKMIDLELLDSAARLMYTGYSVALDSVILGCIQNHQTQESLGKINFPISKPKSTFDAIKKMIVFEFLDFVARLICTGNCFAHDYVTLGCAKNHWTQENPGMINFPITKPNSNFEAGKKMVVLEILDFVTRLICTGYSITMMNQQQISNKFLYSLCAVLDQNLDMVCQRNNYTSKPSNFSNKGKK